MATPSERILKYITSNGIKQSFISKKTGINKSSLHAKLHGEINLTPREIELICWALNKSPSDFIKPRPPESEIGA